MSYTIPTQSNFPTSNQVPDHAIMDVNGKQAYLGNQFIYPAAPISLSNTSETPIFLLSNASTNKKSLFINFNKAYCNTAVNNVIVRMYANPTVTGAGTAKTPVNQRLASGNSSLATAAASPTTSANGTLLATLISLAFVPDQNSLLFIVDPGQSFLLTAQASAGTTSVVTQTSWYEL